MRAPSEADCNEFIDLFNALLVEDPVSRPVNLLALAAVSRAKIAILNGAPDAARKHLAESERVLLQGAPAPRRAGEIVAFGGAAA